MATRFIQSQIQALVVDTSIYAADDVLAAAPVQFKFGGRGGILRGVAVLDADDEGADMKVYVFNSLPSTQTVNAALSLTQNDFDALVARVAMSSYIGSNSLQKAIDNTLAVHYDKSPGEHSLWVLATVDATPTYTATTDIRIQLTVEVLG